MGKPKARLEGTAFGRLTVLASLGMRGHNTFWMCRCVCGEEVEVSAAHLRSGATASCGCIKREMLIAKKTTHGGTGSRLYMIWVGMKGRCFCKTNSNFDYYGGRGITVDTCWADFEPFRVWSLANGYADDLEIDRIDNDGNYTPVNCRWTTRKVNVNNRTRRVAHG